jgi:hypothetical protein
MVKTINYEAPGTGTRRTADQAIEPGVACDASPPAAPDASNGIPVIPWLIPVVGVLILLMTGVIWSSTL